ncbi:hypothetical protein HELRODRAFT_75473 [Helobdella robusta]|uniref:PH domain-containing protein n=1 Tax=Helobdella robusta TaxID=6412 RepID=T1G255_HELRO|nr:hypothetical protein HELRODRAFT_75473 [Helobdella robusta]ESO08227.1 hypothetical protein HELRODRAFT_75473 [Helobdella robusta]
MEGTLLKWTNYFNGWQPRYFILEDGVLSYYYSQDDINNSCKGSIKVAACDINAHSSDPTRLDIVVPGEAHYHLKAATPHDRQLWLVVLGTCKACNNNAGFLIGNQAKNDAEISSHDKLKLKKSELLTYYDILTQHTYNIKMAIKDKTNLDIQLLNDSTTLIGETCESFVKSLDECLRLVETRNHSSSSFSSFQSSPTTLKVPSFIHSFIFSFLSINY